MKLGFEVVSAFSVSVTPNFGGFFASVNKVKPPKTSVLSKEVSFKKRSNIQGCL